MAELVELVKQEEQRQEHIQHFEELPTGLIEIPNLTEESFHRLVDGDYTMEEACKALPEYFHSFLEENLRTTNTEFLRRKVVDADVEKFMKNKPTLTREDILRRLHQQKCKSFTGSRDHPGASGAAKQKCSKSWTGANPGSTRPFLYDYHNPRDDGEFLSTR